MRKMTARVHLSPTNEQFPYSAAYDTSNQTVNHWHKEIEILYVAKGRMPTYINGVLYDLREGEIALIAGGDIHGILHSHPERIVIMFQLDLLKNKYFDDENIDELTRIFNELNRVSSSWPQEITDVMTKIIFSLWELQQSADRGTIFKMKVKALLSQIVILLMEKVPRSRPQGTQETPLYNKTVLKNLQKIFSFLYDHYTENIKIQDVAALLNFSENYFMRFWKKYSSVSFHTYLNEYRIDCAIRMLLETDQPISQICYSTGFQNLKTFNRVFKSITGISPSSYRKMNAIY